jgi:predicted membrane protein
MNSTQRRRALIGLIFIAIGVFLMMRVFNVFPFHIPYYFFSWKMILIALGIIFMISEKNKPTGIILFVIGSIFLARDIFSKDLSSILEIAIPTILVIAGISLLFPKKYFRKYDPVLSVSEDSANILEDVNIFSGGNKFVTSEAFRGGQVTCIFGGAEVNFKNASLAPGENVLDVTCIFGGCTLYVPEDWTVRMDATAVFGGFSDERSKGNPHLVTDPTKVLIVKGVVIFGGGEIKIAY